MEDCSICHEIMSTVNITVTQCNHRFHSNCLINWARKNNSCPCCRKKLYQSTLLVNQNNTEIRNYVANQNNTVNQNNTENQNNTVENEIFDDFLYQMFINSDFVKKCVEFAKYIIINPNTSYLNYLNKFNIRYFYEFYKMIDFSFFANLKMYLLNKELIIRDFYLKTDTYLRNQMHALHACQELKKYVERFLGEEKINIWREEKNGNASTRIYYNRDYFNLDSKWYKRMWKSKEERDQELCMELYNLIDWCIEIYRQ
jgi:hypothetical protein